MTNDKKMLELICQDADMGRDAVEHVLKLTEDDSLRSVLETQLSDYQNSYEAADRLLREKGGQAQSAPAFARMMTRISSDIKTLSDHSSSKIAELVIQGNTMGITTMSKHIHDYDGEDTGIVELAKKQVEMEQRNIEELKRFL